MTRHIGLALLASILLFSSEARVTAEDKEVALPKLPSGAGKVDKDAPKTFETTESGLKYRVLRKGTGEKPTADNTVKVNYEGWLDDGTVFDSSYADGKPISFPL